MKITLTINTEDREELKDCVNLMGVYLDRISSDSVNPMGADGTETVSETQSSPKPKTPVKTAPTQKAKTEEQASSITLAVLKTAAKDAVGRTDRNAVKNVIGAFATKLVEVKEADYGKLYKNLQTLEK